MPLESMGMAPSTHVSVLDINTPWSRPFGHTVLTRRKEDPKALALCLKLSRKRSKPRVDRYQPSREAWKIMLQLGYQPRKVLGRESQGIIPLISTRR